MINPSILQFEEEWRMDWIFYFSVNVLSCVIPEFFIKKGTYSV